MVNLINSICSNNSEYTSSWLNQLDSFLRLQGAFPLIKLHGFLTAVSSCPNMVLPNQCYH